MRTFGLWQNCTGARNGLVRACREQLSWCAWAAVQEVKKDSIWRLGCSIRTINSDEHIYFQVVTDTGEVVFVCFKASKVERRIVIFAQWDAYIHHWLIIRHGLSRRILSPGAVEMLPSDCLQVQVQGTLPGRSGAAVFAEIGRYKKKKEKTVDQWEWTPRSDTHFTLGAIARQFGISKQHQQRHTTGRELGLGFALRWSPREREVLRCCARRKG